MSAVWPISESGKASGLAVSDHGLVFTGSDEPVLWGDIASVEFPTSFSAEIALRDATRRTIGFIKRTDLGQFRLALDSALRSLDQRDMPAVQTKAEKSGPERVQLLTISRVPGWGDVESLGIVTGLTVMSRNVFSDSGSDIKSVFGGNLRGVERAIESGMEMATMRLRAAAFKLAATAVVGVRIDVESVADKAEAIVATGTAVRQVPLPGHPGPVEDFQ